jgi:hypothetical protein
MPNTNTSTAVVRVSPLATSYGLFYKPQNASATAYVAKGRKTLRGDDLADLIASGVRVELNLSQTLGRCVWVNLAHVETTDLYPPRA